MKRILVFVALITTAFTQIIEAQDLTATQVQNIVNSKHYTFQAQTVSPQRGGLRQLTTEYFLQVSGETLVSYLPYFGRAYTAPINPSDAGYDFTSTRFDYTVSAKKKGSYLVSIRTKDKMANTDFALTIYNNGNAYLQVNNSDRQPISYRGYIKQGK